MDCRAALLAAYDALACAASIGAIAPEVQKDKAGCERAVSASLIGRRVEKRSGVVHTIEALEDSVIIEVSTPELDDVVRVQDRCGSSTA